MPPVLALVELAHLIWHSSSVHGAAGEDCPVQTLALGVLTLSQRRCLHPPPVSRVVSPGCQIGYMHGPKSIPSMPTAINWWFSSRIT
jgi:hypothetical protein